MIPAFAAIAVSTLLLVLLCQGDPKRRRTAGIAGAGHSLTARRLLAVAVLLPGIAVAAAAGAAAFLLWFGGTAVAGWFVTLLLSPQPRC